MPKRSFQRKPNRLSYWDYGRPGWYFLTFCTHERQCLFGAVDKGAMLQSAFGRIAHEELLRSASIRAELTLDCFIVMPNHLHLVAVLGSPDHGTLGYKRDPGYLEPRSASSFVAGFKSAVTTRVNTLRDAPGSAVWQRSFYDHIIRSERALQAVRAYIAANPQRWEFDRLHPLSDPDAADEIDALLEEDAKLPLP